MKSTDSGKTWINPVSFNKESQDFLYFRNPSLAAGDAKDLYAVYERKEQAGGKSMLYFGISLDAGLTWSCEPLKGIPYDNPSCYPVLFFSGNTLYCLYADILYISYDGGKNWKQLKSLKKKPSDFGTLASVVKAGKDGEIYILWAKATVEKDTTNAFSGGTVEGFIDVICSKSLNGGRTWMDTHPVNDAPLPFTYHFGKPTERTMDALSKPNNMATVLDMAVAQDGNTLIAVWKDFRGNSESIYFSYSQDKGKTWAANETVPVLKDEKLLRTAVTFYDANKIYIVGSSFGDDPDGRAFHYSGGKIYVVEGNIL
ncbi:MAG: exo-alpha-sialidase [Candidatus Omnitrophica bacterium]|nr:exo-alpha-sialidase [Candidatus Omnitrophota bacterium]